MNQVAERHTVCCIGGMSVDRLLQLHQPAAARTSNPVSTRFGRGGVARNVAENLARLSVSCQLIAVVGDDADGRELVKETALHGVDTALVQTSLNRATGTYTAAIQPDGDLFAGFADMDICESMNRDFIRARWLQISRASIVFADANLPKDSLAFLITGCREQGLPLIIDAVSTVKARRLPLNLNGVDMLFCNRDEARAILGDELAPDPVAMASAICQRGVRSAVVTAGADGLACSTDAGSIRLPAVVTEVIDVTGAGDALIAATLYARLQGFNPVNSLRIGQNGAGLTIASTERNCPDWSVDAITRGVDHS
jgi:pseudouridine kinase